jgi:hypothetical protein
LIKAAVVRNYVACWFKRIKDDLNAVSAVMKGFLKPLVAPVSQLEKKDKFVQNVSTCLHNVPALADIFDISKRFTVPMFECF